MALGFAVLGLAHVQGLSQSAAYPRKSDSPDGSVVFTGDDIRSGQQVFLKYGLMDKTRSGARAKCTPTAAGARLPQRQ